MSSISAGGRRGRRAFTLIEILATLFVLAFGMLSVIALTLHGVRLAERAQAQATGMAAAWTAFYDPGAGGRVPGSAPRWRIASASGTPGPTAPYAIAVEGDLDGWFVRREETSVAADAIDAGSRWAAVRVEVWMGESGEHITSLAGRILRRWP